MTGLISKPAAGIHGTVKIPGDKSISHRVLMLGALAAGETSVTGLLESEDISCTAQALMSLGVSITPPNQQNNVWRIRGMGGKNLGTPKAPLHLGNSGTSARLLMGLIAGYPVSAVLTGDASLSLRPMGRVIKPLAQMGARFETSNGERLPIKMTGSTNLNPVNYRLPVASAQVKSALLLAGLHTRGKIIIIEPQPTRDHTERLLRLLGADITSELQPDGSNIITMEGNQPLTAKPVHVPADPSAAAFLTVAALITKDSDISIPDVLVNPLRTGLYDTLIEMGADISFENRRESSGETVADIRVRSSALKGVTVPPQRVPAMIDEFPILAIAAAFAAGETMMSNLAELRVKESDRLAAIAAGLTAAGVKVATGENSLRVTGGNGKVRGGCTVATQLDHRIAMSFLVMGLAAQEPVAIDNAETIATSFPSFAALLNGLGARIGV